MKFGKLFNEQRKYKRIHGNIFQVKNGKLIRPESEYETKYKFFFNEIDSGNIKIISNEPIDTFIRYYTNLVKEINTKKIVVRKAILEFSDILTWLSGDFLKGECDFLNGWVSGTFENGIFNGGIWGKDCTGIFKGTWKYGAWHLFNKAIFKGKWISGQYLDYDGRSHDDEGLNPNQFKKKYKDIFHLSGKI